LSLASGARKSVCSIITKFVWWPEPALNNRDKNYRLPLLVNGRIKKYRFRISEKISGL